MKKVERDIKSAAARPWSEEDLLAPGAGRKATLALDDGSEEFECIDVLRSARALNAAFRRQRILQRNRACLNAIHPDWLKGPAFGQMSCHGSQAQEDLQRLAAEVVEYFEDRVGYQPDPDPDRKVWLAGEYRPRGTDMIDFERAAHKSYSVADFNTDERAFARALDRIRGVVWARNATTGHWVWSSRAEKGWGLVHVLPRLHRREEGRRLGHRHDRAALARREGAREAHRSPDTTSGVNRARRG